MRAPTSCGAVHVGSASWRGHVSRRCVHTSAPHPLAVVTSTSASRGGDDAPAPWTPVPIPRHERAGGWARMQYGSAPRGAPDVPRMLECVPLASTSKAGVDDQALHHMFLQAALHAEIPAPQLMRLYQVTTTDPCNMPRAVLRARRSAVFRVFGAQIDAGHFRDAAIILRDAYLRPSQPNYMLRMLLRRMSKKSGRGSAPLCTDPAQSAYAALREVLDSLEMVRARHGRLDTHVFVQMLEHLLMRHFHDDMTRFVETCAQMVRAEAAQDTTFLTTLTALVYRMARVHHAHAQAVRFVQALPPLWRTHAMYHDLLEAPHGDKTSRARLASDLKTLPHLRCPSAYTFLAQIGTHARRGHAQRAWADWRALQRIGPLADATQARASLLVARALVKAGRTRLAVRFVERHALVSVHNGTPILNTLLAGVLEHAHKHDDARVRTRLLRHTYACVWRAAQRVSGDQTRPSALATEEHASSPVPARPARRLTTLLARVAHLADAHALRPDVCTLQLLVRAATRWDASMDARSLWHMATLALPHAHSARTHARHARYALFSELASALHRRHNAKSAHYAYARLRQSHRRVLKPVPLMSIASTF